MENSVEDDIETGTEKGITGFVVKGRRFFQKHVEVFEVPSIIIIMQGIYDRNIGVY